MTNSIGPNIAREAIARQCDRIESAALALDLALDDIRFARETYTAGGVDRRLRDVAETIRHARNYLLGEINILELAKRAAPVDLQESEHA